MFRRAGKLFPQFLLVAYLQNPCLFQFIKPHFSKPRYKGTLSKATRPNCFKNSTEVKMAA